MVCPKCNEETLEKIQFKKTGKIAYLCEVCELFWFEGEHISVETGHYLHVYIEEQGTEYSIDELPEKNQDYQSVKYKNYK